MTTERRKNLSTDQFHFFLTDEFSQWYPSAFTDKEKLRFVCCEQYMMYQKAVLFGDTEVAQKIMDVATEMVCKDAKDYKARNQAFKDLGRQVKGFDKDIWDANACNIVYQGNYYKFTQNPALFDALAATQGKELVEAAHYDSVWGVGLRADDPQILDKANWKGKNWLGSTLTKLRDDLMAVDFEPLRTEDNWPVIRFYDMEGQRMMYVPAKEYFETTDYAQAIEKIRRIMQYLNGHYYDDRSEPVTWGAAVKGQGWLEHRPDIFCRLNAQFLSDYSTGVKKSSVAKPTGFKP